MQQPELKRNWSTLLRLHRGFQPLPQIMPDQNQEVLNSRNLKECCQQLREITRNRAFELIEQLNQKIAALEQQNVILQNQLRQQKQFTRVLEQRLTETQQLVNNYSICANIYNSESLEQKIRRIDSIKQVLDFQAQVDIDQLAESQYFIPDHLNIKPSEDILLYSPRVSIQSHNVNQQQQNINHQQTPPTSDRVMLYKNEQKDKKQVNRKLSESQGQLSLQIQSEIESFTQGTKIQPIQKPHFYAYLDNLKYQIGQLKVSVQDIKVKDNSLRQEQSLQSNFLRQSKPKKLQIEEFFNSQIDSKISSKQYQNGHLIRQNQQLRKISDKYRRFLKQLASQIKHLRQFLQLAIQPCQFCSFKRVLTEILNQ